MNKKGFSLVWEKLVKWILIAAVAVILLLLLVWFSNYLRTLKIPGVI